MRSVRGTGTARRDGERRQRGPSDTRGLEECVRINERRWEKAGEKEGPTKLGGAPGLPGGWNLVDIPKDGI